ncbi:MAG TPA: hypothetical protein VK629_16430 [Steroidobacteraceae bacterium]|nr:hypothetical protein [Steroidobacteraceae bacterium]
MQHLNQASLCQTCLDLLSRSIAANPSQVVNLTWCPHRETFAKATVHEGRVVGWELKSPVNRQAADEFFRAQAALANPVSPLPGSKLQ